MSSAHVSWDDPPPELTDSERGLLILLADAYNAYAKLPTLHPSDVSEFAFHIHALQNIVAGRLAVRNHPDLLYHHERDASNE